MRKEESEPCICRPCKGGEGLFAKEEFAMADKQNISSRQTVSEKPNDHEKIYIFGKKCIISAFFLQLSTKKTTKIISKLLTRNKMQIIL